MAQKTLQELKPGDGNNVKMTFAGKDAKIFSKEQLHYDVKNMEQAMSNTLAQSGYGMNIFTLHLTMAKINPFFRKCIVSHELGILRDGYIQRKYGRVMPQEVPAFPEPKQPITPTAAYKVQMYDDFTENGFGKIMAKHDIVKFQGREAFIDGKDGVDYNDHLANVVSDSLSRAYNVAGTAFLAAFAPAVNCSENVDIVPFFDQTLRPDQNKYPNAHDWFDTTKEFGKIIKQQLMAPVQTKLINEVQYSSVLGNPIHTGGEIPKIERNNQALQDNYKDYKKLYSRDVAGKVHLHENTNRYVSLLAMTQAIREYCVQLETIPTPKNMARFNAKDPNNPTTVQICGTVSLADMDLILNPYDGAEIQRGIRNTSPLGNYPVTLEDLRERGLSIYVSDAVLPCNAIFLQQGTLNFNNILSQDYETPLEFALAVQRGKFDYTIPMVIGLGAGCHLIGVGVCPAQKYLTDYYDAFKPEQQ